MKLSHADQSEIEDVARVGDFVALLARHWEGWSPPPVPWTDSNANTHSVSSSAKDQFHFVHLFHLTGEHQWTRQWGSSQNGAVRGLLGSNESFLALAQLYRSSIGSSVVVGMFNRRGDELWRRSLRIKAADPGDEMYPILSAVNVSNSDDVLVAGLFDGDLETSNGEFALHSGNSDQFMAQFDVRGKALSMVSRSADTNNPVLSATAGQYTTIAREAPDLGSKSSAQSELGTILPDGTWRSLHLFPNTNTSHAALAGAGDGVIVALRSDADLRDTFMVRLASDGRILWHRSVSRMDITSLAVQGNFTFFAGRIFPASTDAEVRAHEDSIDLGFRSKIPTKIPAVAIAALDANGNLISSKLVAWAFDLNPRLPKLAASRQTMFLAYEHLGPAWLRDGSMSGSADTTAEIPGATLAELRFE